MGVKDLWTVLTPYSEQKPISELRGKTVAIDLAGWVCESLNVVDYFVHPRHHLKNLFFRTCYLIWEDVTPIFVLEGEAPKLKSGVIAKRNELQFRGVKPKEKTTLAQSQQVKAVDDSKKEAKKDKGRTRFNHVLKQCETLLQTMGIHCVQGPGEAEAYCAFLNKKGLVDGVISQDSDCFAYGAIRVYRNFSVSMQGGHAAQGGAVDIYDMHQISQKFDFGQHKVIVMALLCGCDYCPDGVGGVGRDGVLKFFDRYKENEVIDRIKSWRRDDDKYTALEMRVEDKNVCSNCGHMGRTQSHTKSGCGVCRTQRGCDASLWKDERLSLKAELSLRKKSLVNPAFPSEEIIQEFLTEPDTVPQLLLNWQQPNVVKFIKQNRKLLQWPEIYCFQKFFPILTRWQVRNAQYYKQNNNIAYVSPKQIIKKRTVKGLPSLEVLWQDERGFFKGLIPDEQIEEYISEHPKGIDELWCTVEPTNVLEAAYPEMVTDFIKSKEKPPKKVKKTTNKKTKQPLSALENFTDMNAVTNEIAKGIKTKKKAKEQGLQSLDKFFKPKPKTTAITSMKFQTSLSTQSSTPIRKCLPYDFESDSDAEVDLSDIINEIVHKNAQPVILKHEQKILHYEPINPNLSLLLKEQSHLDDMDLLTQKRMLTLSAKKATETNGKRMTLDDSFDVLVNCDNLKLKNLMEKAKGIKDNIVKSHVSLFKQRERLSISTNAMNSSSKEIETSVINNMGNVSYFFQQDMSVNEDDAFEQIMTESICKISKCSGKESEENEEDSCIIISDDSD